MARTGDQWETGVGGTYIQTIDPAGFDILINGTSKYINFNTTVGSTGYGFRDNAGTMEYKNSGGSWVSFAGSAAGVSSLNGLTGGLNIVAGANITVTPSGSSITIASTGGGGGTPGGSDTQLQYNNAGAFGGITGATTDGTKVTLTTPVLNGTATGTGVSQSSSASTLVQRDSNQNIFVNNYFGKTTSTVSAGGTTVLTVASTRTQNLTGSSSQTFQLPDATTLTLSSIFEFNNNSSSSLIITDNGSSTQYTVPAGGAVICYCTSISTANGTWDFHALAPKSATWSSGIGGLQFNTALSTTPMIATGAASATSPVFIPQRGTTNTGYSGDSTTLYGVIGGATASSLTATAFNLPYLTASQILGTDGSKNVVSLDTTTYPSLTELSYVKGVTSSIQTQLNTKGTGTVTSIATAGLISGGTITTTGTITTSMNTAKLVGRGTAGVGIMEEITIGSGLTLTGTTLSASGGGSSSLSGLTAATATNTIDNLNYAQEWDWSTINTETGLKLNANGNTLTTGTLLNLASASTAYTSGYLLSTSLSGANAASATTTATANFSNTRTGTTSTNIAAKFTASGGTNNYAALFTGYVGIGTSTPEAQLTVHKDQNSVTQSDANGLFLGNATAAQSGTQSISPGIVLQGNYWNTTATANSRDIRFRTDLLPVQGTSSTGVIHGYYQLSSNTNSAGYVVLQTVDDVGGVVWNLNRNSAGNSSIFKMNFADQYANPLGNIQMYGDSGQSVSMRLNSQGGDALIMNVNALVSTIQTGNSGSALTFYTANGFMNFGVNGNSNVIYLKSSNAFAGINSSSPTSQLYVNGSFGTAYVAKTANYTATASDSTIECTANTFTVTLPTAVGITGRIYNISNTGAGTITIGTTSSQTFVNVAGTPTTLTLAAVGSYQVQSNGANWLVL